MRELGFAARDRQLTLGGHGGDLRQEVDAEA